MPTAYLIHGFVGAGKTTFSKKLENDINAARYSPDEWMTQRHGVNPPAEKFAQFDQEIKADILKDAEAQLAMGRDVIFDYGFWRRSERDAFRELAKKWNAFCKLYWVKADAAIMEDRVIRRSAELPEGALFIDRNAINEFRRRFEALQDDEDIVLSKDKKTP